MKTNVKKKTKNKTSKIKNNSLIKGIILISAYFVLSLIVEMINFAMLGFGVFPENILFDLAFLAIICGLLFLIPNNTAKMVIELVLLFVQMVLCVANTILINNTGLVFHLEQLVDAGNGAECLEPYMVNFGLVVGLAVLWVATLVAAIVFNHKFKKDFQFEFKNRLIFWLVSAFSFVVIGSGFSVIGTVVRNNIQKNAYAFAADGGKAISSGVYMKNATMKTMGTFGYYFNDLVTICSNSKFATTAEKDAVLKDLNLGLYNEETADASSKGDNLIYILLESFDEFAIDPYNTPNLWQLANGGDAKEADESVPRGFRLDNFYTMNYTNDSEYISLLGHTTEKYRFDKSFKDHGLTNPYSLPQLFKSAKYGAVNYFHPYDPTYYHRDEIYSAMGFDNVYGLADAKLDNPTTAFGDWVLDSEYIDAMMSKFIPEGKTFFSYYTTISTHGPYTVTNSRLDAYKKVYNSNLESYKSYLKSLGYTYPEDRQTEEELRHYKAAVIDIDKMIGLIFKELERQDILDKTTIILFADHNCFYNNLNAKIKNIEPREFSNIDLYNVPLLIYNNEYDSMSSDKFCNIYDLYPTICDLFGFEHNLKLTQGYSIIRDDIKNSLHVSFKHGIFNGEYYTENLRDIVLLVDNPKMSVDEFKTLAYNFFVEQETVEFVYHNDLYKYKKIVEK